MPTATLDPVDDCIEACQDVLETASRVLARHLGEQPMRDCLRMCLDATDLASAAMQMLQRGSDHGPRVCEVLLDLCITCADACERWPSDECRRCAAACRRCAVAAREVAEA